MEVETAVQAGRLLTILHNLEMSQGTVLTFLDTLTLYNTSTQSAGIQGGGVIGIQRDLKKKGKGECIIGGIRNQGPSIIIPSLMDGIR